MALAVVYTNFNGRLVHENRGGTERGYVPDPLGSTAALVDSTGAVTDTWEYWPYGEVESHSGSSTTPFTFVGTLGYFRDLVSKLTYVRARFYQGFVGQWMTKDPLWPSERAFDYGGDNPITRVDSTGQKSCETHKRAFGKNNNSSLSIEVCTYIVGYLPIPKVDIGLLCPWVKDVEFTYIGLPCHTIRIRVFLASEDARRAGVVALVISICGLFVPWCNLGSGFGATLLLCAKSNGDVCYEEVKSTCPFGGVNYGGCCKGYVLSDL
jgi:RHS repeat-associated protein